MPKPIEQLLSTLTIDINMMPDGGIFTSSQNLIVI